MISILRSLSLAKLVMMSSPPAKSAGDARYASQDPDSFMAINVVLNTISTATCINIVKADTWVCPFGVLEPRSTLRIFSLCLFPIINNINFSISRSAYPAGRVPAFILPTSVCIANKDIEKQKTKHYQNYTGIIP